VPERRAYLRERAAAETFEAPFAELESVDEAEPDDVSRSGH
jgi:hypothetical protein